jgi:polyferredoxin
VRSGRAKFNKQEDRATTGKGDCIDCKQCVNVCPTGIDIRNGTQMECINCTAIDECDTIMDSVGLPKGLIDTLQKMKLRKSVQVYAYERVFSCIIHLTGILIGLLFLRSDVEASILRLPGQLFQHKGDNISNIYTFKIINKTNNDFDDIHFKLVGINGSLKVVGNKN